MVADVMSFCWRDLYSDGYPAWHAQPLDDLPFITVSSLPKAICPDCSLWGPCDMTLTDRIGSQKNNMSHLQGEQRSLSFSGYRTSAPDRRIDDHFIIRNDEIQSTSFSMACSHRKEPKPKKEKREGLRHPWRLTPGWHRTPMGFRSSATPSLGSQDICCCHAY